MASHAPSLCSSTIVSVRWLRRRTNSAIFKYKHKEKYQDKDTSIFKDSSKIACCNRGKYFCLYQPKAKLRAKEKVRASNPPSSRGNQSAATKWRWKSSNPPMPNTEGQRVR